VCACNAMVTVRVRLRVYHLSSRMQAKSNQLLVPTKQSPIKYQYLLLYHTHNTNYEDDYLRAPPTRPASINPNVVASHGKDKGRLIKVRVRGWVSTKYPTQVVGGLKNGQDWRRKRHTVPKIILTVEAKFRLETGKCWTWICT